MYVGVFCFCCFYSQLDALTAAISSSADQYAALSSDFSAEQRRQAAVISRAAEALAEELRAGVAAFDLQQQEFSKSTQEALSTKALEIEEVTSRSNCLYVYGAAYVL